MKRFLISVTAAVLFALPLIAGTYSGDYNYTGTINYDKGCLWSIQGTKVTATASQLNTASTIGITTAALTITRQAAASTTNIAVQTTSLTYLSATGVTSTVVVVTGVVNQAASVAAVTNVVITTQHP